MQNLFGLTAEEMQGVLAELKLPKYRAKQIAEWLYQKGAKSFAEMTNLSLDLRQQLQAKFSLQRPALERRLDSKDGRTSKFLLQFADGVAVETVLMRQPYGNSICVSTQAGCNMGCIFCASTLHGMVRNLTKGEILAQALYIEEMLREEGQHVNTMVIMGSGEPLMNYENVLGFIRLCHEKYCLNMGYRNITLSTSGIVPRIYDLAEEGIPITLSISLHAPEEELRSQLMPINRKYHLEELIAAGGFYAEKTGRRVTYEYILIAEMNDGTKQSAELCRLLKGQLANVNLIPINPVEERGLRRPAEERIEAFADYLNSHHVTATVRKEMGQDINAACGQLRNRHLAQQG